MRSVLTVTSAAAHGRLAREATAATYLGTDLGAELVPLLELASIEAMASLQLPGGLTDRFPLCRQTYTERIILRDPCPDLFLSRRPATALTSLTVDGEAQVLDDIVLDQSAGMLWRVDGARFYGDVVAIFSAGYANDDSTGGEWTVPADLERAVIFVAEEFAKTNPDSLAEDGMVRESIPGVGMTEFTRRAEENVRGAIPRASALILSRYRMPGILA